MRRVDLLVDLPGSGRVTEATFEAHDFAAGTVTTEVGVNRVTWDLRYKGADKIKRAKVDAGQPDQGPQVNPGLYTLKLTVGGQSQTTSIAVQCEARKVNSTGSDPSCSWFLPCTIKSVPL